MSVRAKLKLTQRSERKWSPDSAPTITLRFDAEYDTAIPEDQRFQKATPSAYAEFQIDNPAALEQFVLGKTYYVDFSEA